jgi:dCMP deaminase
MTIQSWDLRWLALVETISLFSKDKSRKIGAVAISAHDQNLLSIGWNGNPRGIADTEERSARINKYRYVIHAESNLIASAARNAIRLDGSTVQKISKQPQKCSKKLE